MSNLIIPSLMLSTKTYHRSRAYSNVTHSAASGKEIRVAMWSGTRFKWDLEISELDGNDTQQLAQYQTLEGFFGARYGDFDSFLFQDWKDNSAVGTFIATTDGSTTKYQMSRTFGPATDAIYNINTSYPFDLYLGGSLVNPSAYTIGQYTGLVTFTSPPSAGQSLTATYSYYFRVRFVNAEMEFESSIPNLWELTDGVNLIEVNN